MSTKETRDGKEITLYQVPDPWNDSFWKNDVAGQNSRKQVAEEMAAVYTLAVGSMGVLGTHLSDACEAFKNFAESKVDDMSADDVTTDMMKAVFGKALDILKDLLPGTEGMSTLAKFLYEGIQDGVRSLLEYPASNLGAIDKDAIKKAIRDLAEAGRKLKMQWYTATPGGEPNQQLVPLQKLSDVVSRLMANLKTNNRRGMYMDEWEFLETFVSTEVDERAALLDHFYGVPSSKSSKLIALKLFKHIARRFSKVYAWGAASTRDKLQHSQKELSKIPAMENKFFSEAIVAYLP